LEVVIYGGKCPGRNLLNRLPARNMLFLRQYRSVRPVIRYNRHKRAAGVCAHVITNDQRVLTIMMIKPVINAFVLHQAAHEIKIIFLILNTVFPLTVITTQSDLKWETIFGQDLAQYLGYRFL